MTPRLLPLRLPLLVEERRRKEEAAQSEMDGDASYNLYMTDSGSSDATSPVTPTFSARGHQRCSSSMSSFELTTPPATCSEGPSSPTQSAQQSGKRILDDVEEEPFEYDDFGDLDDVDDDDASDNFDLYDCLCDEPCIHRDADLVQSTSSFYTRSRDIDYDIGFLSDGDLNMNLRLPNKPRGRTEQSFSGISQRIGSRFPSLTRWKASKKPGSIHSPVSSDFGFENRPTMSRTASSRSSSLSTSGRFAPDRTNEPALPPTPALSFYESSDSVILPGPIDIEKANSVLFSIERERAQASTPLLPPMMASASSDQMTAQPSPLESPTVAAPIGTDPQSPLMLSPPLSSKPSISSFGHLPSSTELPAIPEPDAWSDRLGHANFTIVPQPYKPGFACLSSLRQLRSDWESARVNYTKHLVRTGEHYGITSKTYALTEAKWAETQSTWRSMHDEVADAVVASGEATTCEKFDEGVFLTIPRMDGVGKFPERGDEDIVGPMVREATMGSFDSSDRRRPGFWRNLSGRVGLRK